jgi:hypothetical protein
MGPTIVDNVNRSLREAHAPNNTAIMYVLFSLSGNPIAIARPSCTASDLQPYTSLITKAIYPQLEKAEGQPDSQYFRVKLDHVPLIHSVGSQFSPTEIEHKIAVNLAEFPSLVRPLTTQWLVSKTSSLNLALPPSSSPSLTSMKRNTSLTPTASSFSACHVRCHAMKNMPPRGTPRLSLLRQLTTRRHVCLKVDIDKYDINNRTPSPQSGRKCKLSGNEETKRQHHPLGT